MNLSTRRSAPITRGCGAKLSSAAHVNRLHRRAINYSRRLPARMDLRAIRPVLLSIDPDTLIASISVRTSFPKRPLENKANVACTLEAHRGLTAHEEVAPLAEVFGDDE